MNVSVENEIPYSSCKVVSRSTTGLWNVVTFSGVATGDSGVSFASGSSSTQDLSNYCVTITVEDINESPVFDKPNKQVTLSENVAAGEYLETFTARDPDVRSVNTFV